MIHRLRILLVLARPAVVILLGLFAATGVAQAGAGNDTVLLAEVLVAVVAFLVFAVVVNDLADEAIDRINLAGDRSRPLVSGSCGRRDFLITGIAAGVIALAVSAVLHWSAAVVVAAGMALTLAYSLRPIRLADRGAIASLLLPAGYVGVPYLVGILSVRARVTVTDLVLLAGLYLGFIGRILLKDFRDVRGDALFGKRTFLVRHGRRRTCAVSGAFWIVGAASLAGVRGLTAAFVAAYLVFVVVALVLLRALARDGGPRRDEALVGAVALVGRGMIVTLVGHLAMTDARWPGVASAAVTGALAFVVLGATRSMARRGPRGRLTLPASWVTTDAFGGENRQLSAGFHPENGQADAAGRRSLQGCVASSR